MRKMIRRDDRIARLLPIEQVTRNREASESVVDPRSVVESESVVDPRSVEQSVSEADLRSVEQRVSEADPRSREQSVPVLCHRLLPPLIATRTG
jgi:hypothetical protein